MKHYLYILLIVLACVLLASCFGFRNGDEIVFKQECVGAYNEETYDKLTKYANDRNVVMFTAIAKGNNAMMIYNGACGTVLDVKERKVKVQLSSGKTVWVMDRNIKRRD